MKTNQLPERLRKAITEIRRKPYPISDLIPLLSAAADALQARAQVQGELEPYDAGLLNDFGGGNVEWWQDYIRAELGRAHDFYQSQLATPTAQAHPAEVTDEQIKEAAVKAVKDGRLSWLGFEKDDQDKYTIPVISKSHYQFARAILALRPERVPMTDEIEKCAVVAWAHFMDTCRKKRVSTADWGDWCSANAIRKSHHGITAQAEKGGA